MAKEKETRMTPQWVGLLLRRKFFGLCDDHKELRKSEVNIYCIECNASLCIRRYVYQDVIRLHDMHKFVDCSKVQTFIVNGAKVILLNPKRQAKPATLGNNGGPLCLICRRPVPEPNRYCSLACKVMDLAAGSGGDNGESKRLEEEESSSAVSSSRRSDLKSPCSDGVSAKVPSAAAKRRGASRRKGIPRRAHFF
ncbi:unnamed protein product [Spirodela intermedia]|uniref:Uncharacterized protein n=1 Tax=Spirodela intermedia TaxID=51605 RepID=A0A7I8KDD0_SPIIN|nr:unnamed protein product [Spirodela intermedia]